MSKYLMDFKFKSSPKSLTYIEGEPLKLRNDLNFFHNKNTFRKELNRLQYNFQKYTGTSLVASGIRDSYIKEQFTESYLIVLLTTNEIVKKTNDIIVKHVEKDFNSHGYYIESTSDYMLLIAKDMDSLISGIDIMEEIFTQTFEDYLKQKKFEDFVKIRPFLIHNYT